MNKQEFIKEAAKYVQKYAPQYGIDCYSGPLGQICLESGFGTSELAVAAHNYTGLKYDGRVSELPPYFKVGSEQNADGSYTSSTMKWCNFSSFEKGIEGYFKFISKDRYKNLKGVTDYNKYIQLIREDGYATSLKYVQNVTNTIKDNKLYQYDLPQSVYRVYVGNNLSHFDAQKLSKTLAAKGHSNYVRKISNIYSVCQVGVFANSKNAEELRDKLLSSKIPAYIVEDKGGN